MDRMQTGNARAPSLSPEIVEGAKQAWLFASLEQGAARMRSGHLLWALLADDTLARRSRDASGQLLRIPADLLKHDFAAITAASGEAASATGLSEGVAPTAGPERGPAPAGTGALAQFTPDLTGMAPGGQIDPRL